MHTCMAKISSMHSGVVDVGSTMEVYRDLHGSTQLYDFQFGAVHKGRHLFSGGVSRLRMREGGRGLEDEDVTIFKTFL